MTGVKRWDTTAPNTSGLESKIGYNTAGSAVFTRDAAGHQTNISYSDAFVTAQNQPDGIAHNALAYPTQLSLTETDGSVVSSSTTYNFDMGVVINTKGPPPAGQTAGRSDTRSYDSAGRVLQVTNDANGAYVRYVYFLEEYLIQQLTTIQEGQGENFEGHWLDGMGRQYAITASHPGSTGGYMANYTYYDSMGRPYRFTNTKEITGSGVITGDDAGTQWPDNNRFQSYDWKGRPRITTNQDGTQKDITYGGCGCAGGEEVTTTDEVGRRQRVYADALGRPWKSQILNMDGSVYSTSVNSYNVRDQVTQTREYAGAEGSNTYQDTVLGYDGFSRLQTKHLPQWQVDPNNGSSTDHATNNYNPDDTAYSVVDPRGATVIYGYNARRQVTGITYNAPSGISIPGPVSYSYDAAGNRTSMTDDMGSVEYNYDRLSQLKWENRHFNNISNPASGDHNYKLSYDYNIGGKLVSITDPFGALINYNRDSNGRVTSVTGSNYGGITSYASNMHYRAWGAPSTVSYGDGSSAVTDYNVRTLPKSYTMTGQTMREQYEYYADGRLKQMTDLDDRNQDIGAPDTARHFSRVQSFDLAGRIQHSGGTPGSSTLPYDLYYSYDAFGNSTNRGGWYYYQPPKFDGGTYVDNRRQDWTYFADGKTKHVILSYDSNNNPSAYRDWSYDAAGRMIQVKETIAAANSISTYVTGYDGDDKAVHENILEVTSNADFYMIRSTVLNEVVTRVDSSGNKAKTIVNMDGMLKAVQTRFPGQPDLVMFSHTDPLGLSESGGGGNLKSVYDPLSNYIQWEHVPTGPVNPYPPGSPSFGNLGSAFGAGIEASCTSDGIPVNCNIAMQQLNNGSARIQTIVSLQFATYLKSMFHGIAEDMELHGDDGFYYFGNFSYHRSSAADPPETSGPQNSSPPRTAPKKPKCTLKIRGKQDAKLSKGNPIKLPYGIQGLGSTSNEINWGQAVEFVGTVSDDISTWTFQQAYLDTSTFTYVSSVGGELRTIRDSNFDIEDLGSQFMSQPKGGHTFYGLDAPGINKAVYRSLNAVSGQTSMAFASSLSKGDVTCIVHWSISVSVDHGVMTGGTFHAGFYR